MDSNSVREALELARQAAELSRNEHSELEYTHDRTRSVHQDIEKNVVDIQGFAEEASANLNVSKNSRSQSEAAQVDGQENAQVATTSQSNSAIESASASSFAQESGSALSTAQSAQAGAVYAATQAKTASDQTSEQASISDRLTNVTQDSKEAVQTVHQQVLHASISAQQELEGAHHSEERSSHSADVAVNTHSQIKEVSSSTAVHLDDTRDHAEKALDAVMDAHSHGHDAQLAMHRTNAISEFAGSAADRTKHHAVDAAQNAERAHVFSEQIKAKNISAGESIGIATSLGEQAEHSSSLSRTHSSAAHEHLVKAQAENQALLDIESQATSIQKSSVIHVVAAEATNQQLLGQRDASRNAAVSALDALSLTQESHQVILACEQKSTQTSVRVSELLEQLRKHVSEADSNLQQSRQTRDYSQLAVRDIEREQHLASGITESTNSVAEQCENLSRDSEQLAETANEKSRSAEDDYSRARAMV